MSVDPTTSAPTDRDTSDSALPVTTAPVTTAPVTVGEIAEFLRHLTELRVGERGDDPGARAAFMAGKAELFTRLAADPSTPPAPERRTS